MDKSKLFVVVPNIFKQRPMCNVDHFGDQGPLLVRIWTAGLVQPRCSSSTAAITTLERRQTAFLEVSVAAMRIGARTPLLACLLVSPSGATQPTYLLFFRHNVTFAAFLCRCWKDTGTGAFKCKIHPGSLMQSNIGSSSPLKKGISLV